MLPPRKELPKPSYALYCACVCFSLDDTLKNYVTLNSDFDCEELQKILRYVIFQRKEIIININQSITLVVDILLTEKI